jgi:hypothetical protein
MGHPDVRGDCFQRGLRAVLHRGGERFVVFGSTGAMLQAICVDQDRTSRRRAAPKVPRRQVPSRAKLDGSGVIVVETGVSCALKANCSSWPEKKGVVPV